ncbi:MULTISPECIES: selenium cofactor biosynthesis protein YqeC [Clostridium]|uniref:selenium cofactor biosynthesis protein YqeC n=1 Tax=Clostridium TaxID=1485 RepID=UPI00257F256C|nr:MULTISPECIES: selenium cofactor biosynthesis protein YqeC [Clostridium]MBS4839987.1 putative selenium-dependent hydroxylase accessory protein YqeC [Clostridium sp.]MDU1401260.1 selenium cofactor biosynthesis protein YqeC [Clostridium sp.]MDU1603800.1 selenium cofactor biosynthesis protein YqeC [Clostridium sp.]MDU4924910.1 selenium cofactor biosynthesis protein YqeC [Clostridium sp.]
MKVFNYNNKLQQKEYLYEGFSIDINKKNVISFVGAGGKTTLIYNMAEELMKLGKNVIITTTTNMFISEKYFLYSSDLVEIKKYLNKSKIVVLGTPVGNNKFTSLTNVSYDELIEICDFLLIESDGSRRLPLKAPHDHEPVIIDKSNIIIGVAGIDSVGKSIKDICHRKEVVCNILNVDESHIITEEDIGVLLSSNKGQMKYIESFNGSVNYVAAINKCDNKYLIDKGKKISELLNEKNINSVITSFK